MLSQQLKAVLFSGSKQLHNHRPQANTSYIFISRSSLQSIIMSQSYSTALKIIPSLEAKYEGIITQESLSFLEKLHNNFEHRRQDLLSKRVIRQKEINDGKQLDFLESTKQIRESDWKIAALPKPLLKRRVEITGPVDRKMVINALNSGSGTGNI